MLALPPCPAMPGKQTLEETINETVDIENAK